MKIEQTSDAHFVVAMIQIPNLLINAILTDVILVAMAVDVELYHCIRGWDPNLQRFTFRRGVWEGGRNKGMRIGLRVP